MLLICCATYLYQIIDGKVEDFNYVGTTVKIILYFRKFWKIFKFVIKVLLKFMNLSIGKFHFK